MDNLISIDRIISKYRNGDYTLRELFPFFVAKVQVDDVDKLVERLPRDILEPFITWILDYPLEGGIQIQDAKELPTNVIKKLQKMLRG